MLLVPECGKLQCTSRTDGSYPFVESSPPAGLHSNLALITVLMDTNELRGGVQLKISASEGEPEEESPAPPRPASALRNSQDEYRLNVYNSGIW